MKLWWFVFILLLAMSAVVGWLLVRGEPGELHGIAHDQHPAIAIGANGARHKGVLWLGWVYGAAQIVLFLTLLVVGVGRRFVDLERWRRWSFVVAGGVYLTVFTGVFWLYSGEIQGGDAPRYFFFPRSTIVMLLVLWPVPWLFVLGYSGWFQRLIADR